MPSAVRLTVALVVAFLLGRSARHAWRHRSLATRVWRRIRPGHVAGSLGLLVVVVGVAMTLAVFVAPTRYGLGTLMGISSNAVFAPVTEVAVRTGATSPVEGGGAPSSLLVGGFTTALFALLVTMFPWLAYVEERAFRYGREDEALVARLWTALRFGLIHLVMLIPLAAALAIAVAGVAYGVAYRSAFGRARRRIAVPALAGAADGDHAVTDDDPTLTDDAELQAAIVTDARAEALLASTVWHTTFNTVVVVVVALSLLVDALL